MLDYLFLILGLVLLIKGADWMVSGASSVARTLRVSDFVIGLSVVSFGTSLPELIIALFAGEEGSPDLIIGNVVGSNVANIMLVLGVSAIIYPLKAMTTTVWREIPFTLLATIVLLFLLNDSVIDRAAENALTRTDGVILLLFFSVFIYYVSQLVRSDKDREWVGTSEVHGIAFSIIEIVAGIAGLLVGGHLTVRGAMSVAEAWGMSEAFIGLTIVAIGTSLPELATSAMAAYRKNTDIAVGNIVGSNIFNIFIVLGISSLVHPIRFDPTYNTDMLVLLGATVTLFVFMFVGRTSRTIGRHEGALFVALYVAYLAFITWRG